MIEAKGQWYQGFLSVEPQWEINYSSILTQLIQYAGRYCENYASDLFILWKYNIDANLTNRDWRGGIFKFGFHETGIDKNEDVEGKYAENQYYYRKIATLKVEIDGDKIIMELR